MTPIAATLAPDQKHHYLIFHDETCVHANELDNFAWMREGEQPLRNKSRGRIVHVSDFIIEECGFLRLDEYEISQQLKLPEAPAPPNGTASTGNGRSYEGNDWVPPPPPAPFVNYRLNSFDARRIIYPGAKHDAWWDMPQLIKQVSITVPRSCHPLRILRRQRMLLKSSRQSSLMVSVSSPTTAHLLMPHLRRTRC